MPHRRDDKSPELAPLFAIKPPTFSDATSLNPLNDDLMASSIGSASVRDSRA